MIQSKGIEPVPKGSDTKDWIDSDSYSLLSLKIPTMRYDVLGILTHTENKVKKFGF